jgi:hypothetical protein
MAAMQSELCAINKRRASTLDSAAGVGGLGRQKKKCMQGDMSAGQSAARTASRPPKSVGVASNPARSAGVASNLPRVLVLLQILPRVLVLLQVLQGMLVALQTLPKLLLLLQPLLGVLVLCQTLSMVVPVRMQIKKILISFLFCLHQTLL